MAKRGTELLIHGLTKAIDVVEHITGQINNKIALVTHFTESPYGQIVLFDCWLKIRNNEKHCNDCAYVPELCGSLVWFLLLI